MPPLPTAPRPERVLTQMEIVDRVQHLPAARRATYHTVQSVLNVLVFVLCAALTFVLIVLLFPLIGEVFEQFDEMMLAGLLAVCALMVCAGFSSSPVPEHALPDETLGDSVRRAVIVGLKNGLLFGFGFGLIWGLVVNLNIIYVELNTLVETSFSVFDIIKYGFVFALVVTVPYILLRMYQAASSMLLLKRLESE